MIDPNVPSREPATEEKYRQRAAQLSETALAAIGHRPSPLEFTTWLVAKRPALAPSSWRQYRTAVAFALREAPHSPESARQIEEAIQLMYLPCDNGTQESSGNTSQQKQKSFDHHELIRISHAVLATASLRAQDLVDCLTATSIAGARFVEWPTANLYQNTNDANAWELILENGKNSNGRSHGETRTLRWINLTDDDAETIVRWIATARKAHKSDSYESLQETLESLLRRVSKRLFPRRLKRPTLSSCRHAAVARWKRHYFSLAKTPDQTIEARSIVAALMGHGSDETATKHYARARDDGSQFPIPVPEPTEVLRVRRIFYDLHCRSFRKGL